MKCPLFGAELVQFRMDTESVDWLEARRYDPNESARRATLRHMYRLQVKRTQLDGRSGIDVPFGSIEDLMRAIRDDHPQID